MANLVDGPPSYRVRARREVIQQNAQTVDVALDRRRLARKTSGARYSGVPARIGCRTVFELDGRAEIHQHDAAVVGDE